MTINLHLTGTSFLNSTYLDDSGKPVYKVETPHTLFGHRTSTVTRAIEGRVPTRTEDVARGHQAGVDIEVGEGYDGNGSESEWEWDSGTVVDQSQPTGPSQRSREAPPPPSLPRFAHIAQISWRTIGFSQIRLHGEPIDARTFFRKVGFGWYGRHRAFTAPDGREYRWCLGGGGPSLTTRTNDSDSSTRTLIARYHKRRLGIFGKKRNAYLEVRSPNTTSSGGEIDPRMLDLILVTFLYIEKLRRDRERRARRSGGGGP